MKTVCTFVIFLGSLAAFLLPARVQATTVSECQQLITVVQQDLAGVTIGGNNPSRTRASLESKLSGAIVKLDQAKFCDAIQKLRDFQDAVLALAVPKGKGDVKMDPADAARLAAEADDAINCIAQLLPAGTSCP